MEMSTVNSLLCHNPGGKKGSNKSKRTQEKPAELYLIQMDQHKGEVLMYPTYMHGGQIVQCPELLFDKCTAHKSVIISEDCKSLSSRKGIGPRQLSGAEVSSSFSKGVIYYEAEVSFALRRKIDRNRFLFSAGILQQTQSDPRFLGQDNYSWGFLIEKRDQVTIIGMHNDLPRGSHSLPSYQDPSNWSVRFGFLLDCDNSKFSILEITHGYLIHTFHLRRPGESFIPAFAVYNYNQVEVTVSLKTRGDLPELPTALLTTIEAG